MAASIGRWAAWPAWAAAACAEPVSVELRGAGANTVVVAFDIANRASLRQSVLLRREGGSAIPSVDNQWTCAANLSSGPRLYAFGGDNAATYLDANQVCERLRATSRIAIDFGSRHARAGVCLAAGGGASAHDPG